MVGKLLQEALDRDPATATIVENGMALMEAH